MKAIAVLLPLFGIILFIMGTIRNHRFLNTNYAGNAKGKFMAALMSNLYSSIGISCLLVALVLEMDSSEMKVVSILEILRLVIIQIVVILPILILHAYTRSFHYNTVLPYIQSRTQSFRVRSVRRGSTDTSKLQLPVWQRAAAGVAAILAFGISLLPFFKYRSDGVIGVLLLIAILTSGFISYGVYNFVVSQFLSRRMHKLEQEEPVDDEQN